MGPLNSQSMGGKQNNSASDGGTAKNGEFSTANLHVENAQQPVIGTTVARVTKLEETVHVLVEELRAQRVANSILQQQLAELIQQRVPPLANEDGQGV